MRFDLTQLARRARNPRRKAIVLRDIAPPATLATDLYLAGYDPVVRLWQQASDRLATEYARTLSTLTTDSTADMSGILDEADDLFTRLLLRLEPLLRDWAVKVEQFQRKRWIAAVLSASSVDLTALLGVGDVRDTLENTIAWNVRLIRDVHAQASKRISDAVFAGLSQRQPARDVAKTIREAVGMSRRRSLGIASDQLSKISSALADERRRQAGLDTWEWVHSKKRHPRVDHQKRDGNYYSDEPSRVGSSVDGKKVLAPPPPDDLPSRPPWCGCRSRSVLVFSDD